MSKKKTQITLELREREPAQSGTIGVIFDYYRKKGLPGKVIINANNFKSKSK